MSAPSSSQRLRRQAEARRIASTAYAHRCCVVCGGDGPRLDVLHLDPGEGKAEVDDLAFACPEHRAMYAAGLYPAAALRLMRDHWQVTRGQPVRVEPDGGSPVRPVPRKKLTARRPRMSAGRAAARD